MKKVVGCHVSSPEPRRMELKDETRVRDETGMKIETRRKDEIGWMIEWK